MTTTLSQLSKNEIQSRLANKRGLKVKTGPFTVNIQSKITSVADNVFSMYQDAVLADAQDFTDFYVTLKKPGNLRNVLKPQVQFYIDGIPPFKPLPLKQAFPMLEWGLNLCVSTSANQFLIFHAAVVEKAGAAAILPGPSGSGKSTLCAALINSGWRLLSDELTLISRNTGLIQPLARPVSLKNQSIQIIQNRYPKAVFTPLTKDTAKGTIAHMRPPASSLQMINKPAKPRLVVFPKYVNSSTLNANRLSRPRALIELTKNSFNYSLLGNVGFETLSRAITDCRCFDLKYSNLDDAIEWFNRLAESTSHD